MLNLGPLEILIIGGAVLLVFGPKRLPELAKSMGKGIRDFKKALEGKNEGDRKPLPKNVSSDDAIEVSQQEKSNEPTPDSEPKS